MVEKNRPLYVFKYLWDNTDEDHPAIINDILAHLESNGIHASRNLVLKLDSVARSKSMLSLPPKGLLYL